jgi:hypothetical protein
VKTVFRSASHTDTVLVEKVQMRNAIEAMQGCETHELLVTTSAPSR